MTWHGVGKAPLTTPTENQHSESSSYRAKWSVAQAQKGLRPVAEGSVDLEELANTGFILVTILQNFRGVV